MSRDYWAKKKMFDAGVVGILLAGGKSRRMGGGDKCLRILGTKTILRYVIDRARPQVGSLVLNANGDLTRFAEYRLPLVSDSVDGFVGPLAGVLAGMDWVSQNIPDANWIASFATDAPFLPSNMVEKFLQVANSEESDIVCAASNRRRHPVFGLWPVRLKNELRDAIVNEGIRKVEHWTSRYRFSTANFRDDGIDPFFNANRPTDLIRADAWLRLNGTNE